MALQSSFITSEKTLQFLQEQKAGYIMFCKSFKIHGAWNIGAGAVVDINQSSQLLRTVCRELYIHDKNWFAGDMRSLFNE